MKKLTYIFALMAVVLVGAFAGCSETEEESVYDHWQEKNKAYADSLLTVAGSNLFAQAADTAAIDAMPLGQLFGIKTQASTTKKTHYVFCKKLSATDGRHPIYTDYVSAYYCGSYFTGTVFDSNFNGYVGSDTSLYADEKLPEVYNTPTPFSIQPIVTSAGTSYVIVGWQAALQYMRVGERWMLYVPYESAYGSDGSRVRAYSALCFDIILSGIVE